MGRIINFEGHRIDADALLRDLDRADCEDSLYTFLQHAWQYMDPAPWKDGWVGQAIAEHLEGVIDGEITRLLINIPPRTLKTSLCSVSLPAWTWAQRYHSPTSGPGVKFMYASYGESLSLDHSVMCRRLIKSPWYQELWGDRFKLMSDMDTKHKFTNDRGGERQITSVDARVTGRGSQIIVVDDPNAANEAHSEAKIEGCIKWWDRTMQSRLNDRKTGAFILVQQRVAENDLSGHILEKNADGWVKLILPMEYEPNRSFITFNGWEDPRVKDGELLWPERFDEEDVLVLKRDVGPWAWAGQYQQRPEPDGGGIIKRDWWKLWERAKYPALDYIIASLDTAYTMKTENDFSAMTIWGVFQSDMEGFSVKTEVGGNVRRSYTPQSPRVVLMFAWQERLELHDLVQKVQQCCKDYRVDKLLIENKAAGHSVAQELRRLFNAEDFGVQLIDPGAQDKMARLYSVQHIFSEGMVYAPDRNWAEMVISQVGTFPRGKHDDLVDTCSAALRHLRDLGLLARQPELQVDIERAGHFTGNTNAPLYGVP